jgi:hypothetical protein
LGDLLYDDATITELTDPKLMQERALRIAADPEGERKWNEYRASTGHMPNHSAADCGP